MAAMHGGFADLVSTVRPAVVNVEVTRAIRPAAQSHAWRQRPGTEIPEFFRRFLPMPWNGAPGAPRAEGVGSGFIIDASGLVVTSHHVVKGADTVTVTLHDGRTLEARVAGADPKTDLALLEVDVGEALPTVEFGDSDTTRVGDWVVAVGEPLRARPPLPRASSPRGAATSARVPMTTTSSSTPRSTAAAPAARCSTAAGA